MQASMGRVGRVQSVDRAAKLVLLRFYEATKGVREEYWYHASLLSALPASPDDQAPSACDPFGRPKKRYSLEKQSARLAKHYAAGVALLAHHVLSLLRAVASAPPRLERDTKNVTKPTDVESSRAQPRQHSDAAIVYRDASVLAALPSRTHPTEHFLRTCYLPSILHLFSDASSVLTSLFSTSLSARVASIEASDAMEQCRAWWIAQTIRPAGKSAPKRKRRDMSAQNLFESRKLSSHNNSNSNSNNNNNTATDSVDLKPNLESQAAQQHPSLPFLHEAVVPIIRTCLEEEASLSARAVRVGSDQSRIGMASQVRRESCYCYCPKNIVLDDFYFYSSSLLLLLPSY
jgi:hypothetical protein